jgi:hypothetical protein
MSMKYVKNTGDATIVCRITSDKEKVFTFRGKKIDKRNNIVLANGYTEIDDADLAILKAESHAFNYYEKLGKLKLVDSLPQDSMSPEQLIISLKSENSSLKQQLADKEVIIKALDAQLQELTVEKKEVKKKQPKENDKSNEEQN